MRPTLAATAPLPLADLAISLGNGALVLLLLPLGLVAAWWLRRNVRIEPAPAEPPAAGVSHEPGVPATSPARLRRGAVRWLVATLASLAFTLYLTRGWTSGPGTVLLVTVLVAVVVRYPFWWTFRAFRWALQWTLRTAREARSTGARLAGVGLGLLLLPGLLFFAFWAFPLPASPLAHEAATAAARAASELEASG